jgi:hypothetical protein
MKTKQLPLVTFEQAKRLKKRGFGFDTVELYHDDGKIDMWALDNHNAVSGKYSAPTVALALKGIRDEKKFYGEIALFLSRYSFHISDLLKDEVVFTDSPCYGTCEAAESALLDELLTLLEREDGRP